MINATFLPARNLQKSYKAIIKEVKSKKGAVILTTNKKPQAAIVSLEDLEKLQQTKIALANLKLLELANECKSELKDLPANLRERADDILYS